MIQGLPRRRAGFAYRPVHRAVRENRQRTSRGELISVLVSAPAVTFPPLARRLACIRHRTAFVVPECVMMRSAAPCGIGAPDRDCDSRLTARFRENDFA